MVSSGIHATLISYISFVIGQQASPHSLNFTTMVSRLIQVVSLTLAFLSQVQSASRYTLNDADNYSGPGFFDKWNFYAVGQDLGFPC